MKNQFWVLKSPDAPTYAEWDHGKVELDSISCPISKGHRRPGKRLTDLSVLLPKKVQDFVWTWYSECLLRDETLSLLREAGFTGFNVKPVTAKFKRSKETPPKLWELVLIGWGGMASAASGIRLDEAKSCRDCGMLKYTDPTDTEHLIDESQWDGSDFFMVWPMPRFIFVTARVVDLIREQQLKGVRIVPLSEIKTTGTGLGGGRLSYWMPDERAKKLGEPLGIY